MRLKWDQTSKWFEVRVILDLVGVENSCDYRLLQENGRGMMVGVERPPSPTGIEPPVKYVTCIKSYGYNISCKFVLNHLT